MPRRLTLLLLAAFALALAPAARAQQDTPFGPVPTPAPTVEPVPGGDDVSRGTLFLIAGAVLIGVVGIGYAIARDARRSLSAKDRAGLEQQERLGRGGSRHGVPSTTSTPAGSVSREAQARARKQRAKAKAARAQRKRNR